MNYDLDIIPLLKKFEGMQLESVSGQSNILVKEVNESGVLMICSDGKEFRETHKRAKVVFEVLLEHRVVHVDAALKNSGTRRNIPETLLANLPFIEHVKINGQKHLFFNKEYEPTHHLGTLKSKDK
jgi:hypothetical protein